MGEMIKIADLFGTTRLSSRWVQCPCGRFGCGQFVNRLVEYDGFGNCVRDEESLGIRAGYPDCTGRPPESRLDKIAKKLFRFGAFVRRMW